MPLTDAEREELAALEQLIPAMQQHLANVDAALADHDNEMTAISETVSTEMSSIEDELNQAEADIRARLEQEATDQAHTALQ